MIFTSVTIAALSCDKMASGPLISQVRRGTVSQCHNSIVSRGRISSGINISNGQCLSVSSLSSNQWHCCQATTIMCRGFESTLLISSYSVTQHSEFHMKSFSKDWRLDISLFCFLCVLLCKLLLCDVFVSWFPCFLRSEVVIIELYHLDQLPCLIIIQFLPQIEVSNTANWNFLIDYLPFYRKQILSHTHCIAVTDTRNYVSLLYKVQSVETLMNAETMSGNCLSA